MLANDIRPGDVLDYMGQLWKVLKAQHTKPGKGGAYMQVEMKSLRDSIKKNERIISSKKVVKAVILEKECLYLYSDADTISLMYNDTHEQFSIPNKILLGDPRYLSEGMVLSASEYNSEIISLSLPKLVSIDVSETESVIKGQTASSSYKPAILSNGVKVSVPPFVNSGDVIVVNTEDNSYSSRQKN